MHIFEVLNLILPMYASVRMFLNYTIYFYLILVIFKVPILLFIDGAIDPSDIFTNNIWPVLVTSLVMMAFHIYNIRSVKTGPISLDDIKNTHTKIYSSSLDIPAIQSGLLTQPNFREAKYKVDDESIEIHAPEIFFRMHHYVTITQIEQQNDSYTYQIVTHPKFKFLQTDMGASLQAMSAVEAVLAEQIPEARFA